MNVKLLTKDFFKKRGGEQLGELDDKTKIVSFIKLPKSVNDYMGDKGQTKNFKFSSVDTDIFDEKSGPTSHFTLKFNQPKGMKAIDNFYDEMLPPVDYSGEIPEYYKYKLNKGKTINDRIADKLRENALDEDATRLPEAQELYPQLKTQKGEAYERFKAQVEKYKAEKRPTLTITENEGGGGEGPPPEIEVKPVKKYSKPSAEERQKILRAEKMDKLEDELNKIEIMKLKNEYKARRKTEKKENENLQNESEEKNTVRENKVRKQSNNNKTLPAESSILNKSDEKVNDAQNKTPEKANKDKSAVSAHTEAPKKPKLHSPVLIGTQGQSLMSSFTEVSEDKDEDFEELEQTPKKTPLQIKEEFLKKFEDADRAQRALNITMEFAHELETEIEKVSKDKNFKKMKADVNTMKKYNALKEANIINVKNTVGRKTVKLETILKNIKISTNLKALRKKQADEIERRKKDIEEDQKKRYPPSGGATVMTLGGGGGGEPTVVTSNTNTNRSKTPLKNR